ncbi:MAG TPA: mannose-6-phosphate isomerase, class I [Micromonosporaceae bacterium]|jgi:mannose-6-phosphate isomerase|nr:mannose-6-phosphate isomerase, class I [Micromonosporaceae bacterium]
MDRLSGVVRPYAWGSRTVIAELQGRPVPSTVPEAELWFGAHPTDPSTVDGVSLADVVARDPGRALGPAVVDRFGPRLPYLVKVLAAEQPLSLQAHPDATQARTGYAAADPNYVDPYHKPELLVAVSEFEALCGFRDPLMSARALSGVDLPALDPVAVRLAGSGPVADRLRYAMTTLLSWPADTLADTVSTVAGRSGSALIGELARRYPADPGVLVTMLLNHVRLAPGEAIWMPAGNLHTYVRGTGVEVMAASDNVLRGGFTAKRVDVAELLRVLRFEVLADPVVRAVDVAPGVLAWPAPVDDFALCRVSVDGTAVDLAARGPRVALCLAGEVTVEDGVAAVTLRPGEGAFGPADAGPLTITGHGEVYLATPGLDRQAASAR